MVGDVQRLAVGAEGDAVGLLDVVRDLDHAAVGVDAIDGPVLELARLVAEVVRVGEVDAALRDRGRVVAAR